MIFYVQRRGTDAVVADFGCGEARLAARYAQEEMERHCYCYTSCVAINEALLSRPSHSVPNTVHSFDLVACNDRGTAATLGLARSFDSRRLTFPRRSSHFSISIFGL
jgi:hypothetical protein